MSKLKQFYTVIEVAKIMDITRAAVYKKIANGQIKAENIHGRTLIPLKGIIEEYVAKELTEKTKNEIDRAVAKTVKDYTETLKMLGKE